ncbi:hypothetical protein JW968_03620 [Candidatus Woesearchaeota archaeon]|nr:hypothetical protein [Candidatus Woesearchaeota archaeon]
MGVYFKESMSIFMKTLPFIFIRFALQCAFLLVSLIYFAILIGITILIGKMMSGDKQTFVTIIFWLFALGGTWTMWKLFKSYVYYLVKSAHVAVITEIVREGKMPPAGQVKYGIAKVKKRFVSTSAMFVLDKIINAVIRGINHAVSMLTGWIPIPQVQQIIRLFMKILNLALSYIDEAIMSYIYGHDELDAWTGARDGIILYFKNWKPILKTSAFLVIFGMILSGAMVVVFWLIAIPVAAILPDKFAILAFIGLMVFGYIIKAATVNPFILISIIVTYNESIKGYEPDYETQAKLEQMVPKFREITSKSQGGSRTAEPQSGFRSALSGSPLGGLVSNIVGSFEGNLTPEEKKQVDTLVPFIKDSRTKGFSDDQIRESIAKQGYPQKVLSEAFKKA